MTNDNKLYQEPKVVSNGAATGRLNMAGQHKQHRQQQVASITSAINTCSDYSSTSDDYYRDEVEGLEESDSDVAANKYDLINHHLADLMPNQYFNEALLAVASAEEYAAKILALQQACLRPLKEDLADWLNKIMSTSVITTDNFMHKLDNGVVICRLAKIISVWVLEQMSKESESDILSNKNDGATTTVTNNLTSIGYRDLKNHQLEEMQTGGSINPPTSTNSNNTSNNYDNQVNQHSNNSSYSPHLSTSNKIKQTINDNDKGLSSPRQYQHNNFTSSTPAQNYQFISGAQSRLSVSSTNVKDLLADESQQQDAIPCAIVTPSIRQHPFAKRTISSTNHLNHHKSSLRSYNSQSTNCLNWSSQSPNASVQSDAYSQNNYAKLLTNGFGAKRFLDNLIQMDQTKIWEDARCRTFYARDNVCNFIRWSKEFGVNQSVLFESDDLVLHANPRQVVLCLLDVARIACVKHGFTEAPGLVKFEQQIEAEAAQTNSSEHYDQYRAFETKPIKAHNKHNNGGDKSDNCNDNSLNRDTSRSVANSDNSAITNARARLKTNGRGRASIGDATDELILRYCKHKEEQQQQARERAAAEELEQQQQQAAVAAKLAEEQRKAAEEEAERLKLQAEIDAQKQREAEEEQKRLEEEAQANEANESVETPSDQLDLDSTLIGQRDGNLVEPDSTTANDNETCVGDDSDLLLLTDQDQTGQTKHCERVDSLDSGEGRTESASTSHTSRTTTRDSPSAASSRTGASSTKTKGRLTGASSIPTLIRRTSSSLSLTSDPNTNSLSTSQDELSSSRSSLLSANGASSSKDHDPMDLDGKVMRIAKSYYGKGARRGVTRLSEGKYKIADRIVFVRLLKGHRVMVRIGGGWDTLENFLFRHKSDPSQVIDVDNLLPLEAKMTSENKNSTSHQSQQGGSGITHHSQTKRPFYKRSDSASSTNLSLSNRSIANSPTSSSINSHQSHNQYMQAHGHLYNAPSLSLASSTPSSPFKHNKQQHPLAAAARPHSTAKQATHQSRYILTNRGQNLKVLPQSIVAAASSTTAASSLTSGSSSIRHYFGSPNSPKHSPSTPTNSRIPQQRPNTVHKFNRTRASTTSLSSSRHQLASGTH